MAQIEIEQGDILTVQLDTGHDVSLTWRPEGDYRVTVMRMAEHIEQPRHFADEYLARQHARGLVVSYRPTGTEITVKHDTSRRVRAAA